MEKLYPRHEKRTKNPAETTGNRYKIEILMSRMQKLKGLSAASLILKTLSDNPYIDCNEHSIGSFMHKSTPIFHGITELLYYAVACVH